jgi:hypothetical protein
VFSRYLEQKGAAVRYPTLFREFVQKRRERDAKELIALLSRCDLLRHLPPEEIEVVLPSVRTRRWGPGQILFSAGDPGDALYIVASGKVEILEGDQLIASLSEGEAFGEMALLSGSSRTAADQPVAGDRAADRGRLPLRPIPGARRILRPTGDATPNAGSGGGR